MPTLHQLVWLAAKQHARLMPYIACGTGSFDLHTQDIIDAARAEYCSLEKANHQQHVS